MSELRRRIDLACGAVVLVGLIAWARWGGVEAPVPRNPRRGPRVLPQADVATSAQAD